MIQSEKAKLMGAIERTLEEKNIFELRQIGRVVGLPRPSDMKKEVLIGHILNIASGVEDPAPRSAKGAPPKSVGYDKDVVNLIERCRKLHTEQDEEVIAELMAASETKSINFDGVLDVSDKMWFVRTQNFEVAQFRDVFIHASFVPRFDLRIGDRLTGTARVMDDGSIQVEGIKTVNGNSVDILPVRLNFDSFDPLYPTNKLNLTSDVYGNVISTFAPVGIGSRVCVKSDSYSMATSAAMYFAESIANNNDVKVVLFLVDNLPEDAVLASQLCPHVEIVSSSFDKPVHHRVHAMNLVMEYLKRQAETGKDVVVVIDNFTRMVRSCNLFCNLNKTITNSIDPKAFVEPRKFISYAKNTNGCGTITVVATFVAESSSEMDNVIYDEFKSYFNTTIVLDDNATEVQTLPVITISKSRSKYTKQLLGDKLYAEQNSVRSRIYGGQPEFEVYNEYANNEE